MLSAHNIALSVIMKRDSVQQTQRDDNTKI